MHLETIRDRVADLVAQAAIDGAMLSLCTHAYALDLGLDVQAIENNPRAHLLENRTNG